MKIHPFCAAYPDMSHEKRAELAAHIAIHKQRDPIWTYKGQIIDGKSRYAACSEAGLEPWTREWKPKAKHPGEIATELYHFVVGCNLRRDMDQSQRAMAASRLLEAAKDAGAKLTVDEAAEQFSVSPRSVASANAILKEGNSEIIQAVDKGTVSVSKAAPRKSNPNKAPSQKPAKNTTNGQVETANLQSPDKPSEVETPFCAMIERCKWVDKHAHPGIMELALDIQRQLGTRAGSFSANQIQVHITNIHNAFQPVVKILIAARERYRKER